MEKEAAVWEGDLLTSPAEKAPHRARAGGSVHQLGRGAGISGPCLLSGHVRPTAIQAPLREQTGRAGVEGLNAGKSSSCQQTDAACEELTQDMRGRQLCTLMGKGV